MTKVRPMAFVGATLCAVAVLIAFRRERAGPAEPVQDPQFAQAAATEPVVADSAREIPFAELEAPPLIPLSIHKWARVDPAAAGRWILGLPDAERLEAATNVLVALADRPASALALAQHLCREDPGFVRDHGETLVVLFAETDRPEMALRFAELGGPERSAWLALTLQIWARKDPARAAEAALSMDDGDGFARAATEWAARDPEGLAGFFLRLDSGASGSTPPDVAFQVWQSRSPAEVAAWFDRL
jgi:hypothetical protein